MWDRPADVTGAFDFSADGQTCGPERAKARA
jgi:hypothetical protein